MSHPCGGSDGPAARRIASISKTADWLVLAALPTCAIMALLTTIVGGADICSSTPDASPLNGMAAMYLLMSAFHAAPWLKLLSSRQGVVDGDGRRSVW
ncbi:hypothetical protein KEU06_27060 [Pseudaminobacter sp. 19-2017]|uniref:Uncharacterized protein n=1 Tax=Pseudaminobacter soli (ex Zhang et al. 2022) TaxID=2831468 RepID=A0A942E1W2_9HYPH|nr:hypothetical protein [Pseudaminobacter soli]MBS3652259.1 hypothetical protein [Pseudaminobacter soli]